MSSRQGIEGASRRVIRTEIIAVAENAPRSIVMDDKEPAFRALIRVHGSLTTLSWLLFLDRRY